jgi:hypothetical protein
MGGFLRLVWLRSVARFGGERSVLVGVRIDVVLGNSFTQSIDLD